MIMVMHGYNTTFDGEGNQLLLPVLRRAGAGAVRMLLGVTLGLLAFLAIDGDAEGVTLAERAAGPVGGPTLVALGATLAVLRSPSLVWQSA